tara:strand:- start:3985 stop:4332 length:348 start_codon:yes stop_codon:yes gene_type:complete
MNNYNTFYLDNFIEKYAAQLGKPVLYLKSTGWNASSDVDAINASYAVYQDILPNDLWTALKNSEHVFCEIDDDVADTMEWLSDNLPSSQASTATPENYIFYSLVNAEGQQLASNE